MTLYDAAGNLTYDGTHHYTYDGENRLVQVDSGATATYIDDTSGSRVEKQKPSAISDYLYDNGQVASRWTNQVVDHSYLYLEGKLLADYSGSNGTLALNYAHVDHLGSTRLLTVASGSTVTECDDYYPYGELIGCANTSEPMKFTGKERDVESGLDNFGFRYSSSSIGRWMNPDPTGLFFSDPSNPQSFNLYSYVRGNPVNSIDTDGLLTIVIPGTWWSPQTWDYKNPLVIESAQHFDEHYQTWLDLWDPRGDNDKDRNAASRGLANYINNYHFAPGETLNIVATSHGGNIALRAATLGLKHRIDTLITLGTPFGYASISQGIGRWYNVTGSGDDVQPLASKGCWSAAACTTQTGAQNVTVLAGSHSALWNNASVRNLWWTWFLNQQWGGGDNGHGAPPAAWGPLWHFW